MTGPARDVQAIRDDAEEMGRILRDGGTAREMPALLLNLATDVEPLLAALANRDAKLAAVEALARNTPHRLTGTTSEAAPAVRVIDLRAVLEPGPEQDKQQCEHGLNYEHYIDPETDRRICHPPNCPACRPTTTKPDSQPAQPLEP